MATDWKRIGRITATVFEWIGVVVFGLLVLAVVVVGAMLGGVGKAPEAMGGAGRVDADAVELAAPSAAALPPAPTSVETGSLFAPVHEVLVSPRCMNCHPDGDRPLVGDGQTHAMNVSRASADAGLPCSTCHADHNSKVVAGPPGAPDWGLPPADTPMVFEGRSVTALCEQLRDPASNGQRSLAQLLDHVGHDPLVLWGWVPGGDRQPPPISHAAFVEAFAAWVEAGGLCPGEREPPELELAAVSDDVDDNASVFKSE